MVAPHVETQLTRSLVRVPNSGRDRRAGTILLDLSKVSSAAALVPITSYLALGMMPSGMSPWPSSSLPIHENPKKLYSGAVSPEGSRVAARNGSLQVGTVGNGGYNGTTTQATVTRRTGMVLNGNLVPVRAVPMNLTSSTSAAVNPVGGRKRSLPVMVQDTTLPTTEGTRSPKVRKATTMTPNHQPRCPAPRRHGGDVITMEHLQREINKLRSENLVLKQQLMRRLQQILPPTRTGPVRL